MGDVVSDKGVADKLAAGLQSAGFSAALVVSCPTYSRLDVLTAGAVLGDALKGYFGDLEKVVVAKAENLRQIAAAFDALDKALAGGVP